MNWVEAIGYLGTGLTVTASAMSTMIPLRIAALLASAAMLAYGILTGSMPIVLTELIQIPFNAVRLYQMVRLVRDVKRAADGDLSLEWLKPFGRSRRFTEGQVLFEKGEAAVEMFYVESGHFRIPEHAIEVRPGDIVGELGMLSPGNLRTGSLVCVEAGAALCVPYTEVKQLYYQNPEFGFYFLKLTSERLFQAAGHASDGSGSVKNSATAKALPAGTDVM